MMGHMQVFGSEKVFIEVNVYIEAAIECLEDIKPRTIFAISISPVLLFLLACKV